jgi:hypothetical protein
MKFSYQANQNGVKMPLLDIGLQRRDGEVIIGQALIDSGATPNVLPHALGLRLGLVWDNHPFGPRLSGNADGETRVVALQVRLPGFVVKKLVFVWAIHDRVRLILGQDDFFKHYKVCFLGAENAFSIEEISGDGILA